jgi:radical SAM superfamily enzyme YgiQ (UPF0313 family)
MQLMKDAGFISVFLGIETPDESGLIAANKLQNTRRSLLDSVATIQSYGMQVMGGFILGFDTDREDIFDRMVDFIQKSGIPIAMVGLLQAMPGTQLFRRLWKEGRILDAGGRRQHRRQAEFSSPHGCRRLVEGYRSVLKRIYGCEAYYERVKLYLNRTQPKPEKRRGRQPVSRQQWMTRANARAFVTSMCARESSGASGGVIGSFCWRWPRAIAIAWARP